MTFSRAVRWANRLNVWNTIPMSRRISLTSASGAVTGTPSRRISPPSTSVSRFTQRSSVDLPLPEGPTITVVSPASIPKLTPSSTRSSP